MSSTTDMVLVTDTNWMGGDNQVIVQMGAMVPLLLAELLVQPHPCRLRMKHLQALSSSLQDHLSLVHNDTGSTTLRQESSQKTSFGSVICRKQTHNSKAREIFLPQDGQPL